MDSSEKLCTFSAAAASARLAGMKKNALLGASAAVALIAAAPAMALQAGPAISYVAGSLAESTISQGPWTLHESTAGYQHDASGIVPPSGATLPHPQYGSPYNALCNPQHQFQTNHGVSLMQPYYFPFVRATGSILEGFFDYRPRNEQEAFVGAVSSDWGKTWTYRSTVLALNPYCPADVTDPDNNNVLVNSVVTAYGSDANNAADNGLGHPVVLTVGGKQFLYQLNRANNHIDSDPLVVHELAPWQPPTAQTYLPAYGYVSPLVSGGYPTLNGSPKATTGLINPDAIMGSVTLAGMTTVVYVEKTLNGDTSWPSSQICPKTPKFALTNLVNGKARKTNDDVTTVRVATTTDGINFTDVGATSGLFDPTTVALNGTRWLGSGSLIRLTNGHVGMFFGAGNCLDNDSDGFHYIGYAETTNVVSGPPDLLSWTVVHGFDNPILSTDTVATGTTASPGTLYPANPPVVNVYGANALTPTQVLPFVPPTSVFEPSPKGYNSNFFSGRVYDPQAFWTDPQTVTIIFAGYNTPQPSNNLGDYRSIGRFQLRFPSNYVLPPSGAFSPT